MLVAVFLLVTIALASDTARAQQREIINGTIFTNNRFLLFINGELVGEDPEIRHNAYNVTFQVPSNEDITFAIMAIDNGNETTGLEFGNRCLGSGGLIGMFSNGVVTDSDWTCYTINYGPTNWLDCFAALNRNGSLKQQPLCRSENLTSPIDGCMSRLLEEPANWRTASFDDSNWERALVYDDSVATFGVPPAGCSNPNITISTDTDINGANFTCQGNVNWSAYGKRARFIWREDLFLDNTLLCRYKLQRGTANTTNGSLLAVLITSFMTIVGTTY